MCPWPKIRTNCNSKWKNYCARYHRPQLSKIFGQFNTHQCDNVPCGHSGCFLQFQNTHFWNYICWQLCRHLWNSFFLQSVSITCALDIYYVRQPSIWRKLILRLSLETLSMRQLANSPFSWPLGHILHHRCSASNESQISKKKSHSLFKHILIGKRAAGVCGDYKFWCCVAAATTLVATFVCCELSQSQSNKVFIPPPPLHSHFLFLVIVCLDRSSLCYYAPHRPLLLFHSVNDTVSQLTIKITNQDHLYSNNATKSNLTQLTQLSTTHATCVLTSPDVLVPSLIRQHYLSSVFKAKLEIGFI